MVKGIQTENSKNEVSQPNLGYIYYIERLCQGQGTLQLSRGLI